MKNKKEIEQHLKNIKTMENTMNRTNDIQDFNKKVVNLITGRDKNE